ncbi:phosphoribosyltransferase-like protein [Oceaniglobus trochenteri]|uniref:phosphoribosyltransferase-like protein n=1 Tax=Oceaniglobus trochenteri TaxID=2763260 RepID=UPI001CFFDE73|nr:hypothetical protein [Oceaniglobus trochenteri]
MNTVAEEMAQDQLSEWVHRFRFYRNPPDRGRIQAWLDQFEQQHRGLAERLLDIIQVVSDQDVLVGYRDFLRNADGWDINEAHRRGRWYFVGFGGSGESGPHMVRLFREANVLNATKFDSLFVHLRDLPSLGLTAEDTVIFIDDIAGSGDQACRLWPTIQELIASEAKAVLLLTAVTYRSEARISSKTELVIACRDNLGTECDLFHDDCTAFDRDEKSVIEGYCKKADKSNPRGYGNCGLFYVLAHKTPNNCLPIIHAHNKNWGGILPRYTPLPD